MKRELDAGELEDAEDRSCERIVILWSFMQNTGGNLPKLRITGKINGRAYEM